MRLWTLHPKYLDPQGLVALWREALLAQRVLQGRARGYRSHPQLHRFREADEPLAAIAAFLRGVHAEAVARGYAFDERLIGGDGIHPQIPTARGQLLFEVQHLRAKLGRRSPRLAARLNTRRPVAHPLFRIVRGDVEAWERAAGETPRRQR